MKILSLTAATAALVLSAGVANAETTDAWYVRAEVGPSFKGLADGKPDFKGDTGWTADGAVGRTFGPRFRAEAELLGQGAEIKGPRIGHLRTLGGFANGYFNFNPGGSWQPFVGAGIGVARVEVHKDHDHGFAYQAKAGISKAFSDRLAGELAYRYMRISKVKAGVGVDAFDGHYHDQAVTVGLRYSFGS